MSKETHLMAFSKALVQAQRTDIRGYRFRKFQRQAVKFYKRILR